MVLVSVWLVVLSSCMCMCIVFWLLVGMLFWFSLIRMWLSVLGMVLFSVCGVVLVLVGLCGYRVLVLLRIGVKWLVLFMFCVIVGMVVRV